MQVKKKITEYAYNTIKQNTIAKMSQKETRFFKNVLHKESTVPGTFSLPFTAATFRYQYPHKNIKIYQKHMNIFQNDINTYLIQMNTILPLTICHCTC